MVVLLGRRMEGFLLGRRIYVGPLLDHTPGHWATVNDSVDGRRDLGSLD